MPKELNSREVAQSTLDQSPSLKHCSKVGDLSVTCRRQSASRSQGYAASSYTAPIRKTLKRNKNDKLFCQRHIRKKPTSRRNAIPVLDTVEASFCTDAVCFRLVSFVTGSTRPARSLGSTRRARWAAQAYGPPWPSTSHQHAAVIAVAGSHVKQVAVLVLVGPWQLNSSMTPAIDMVVQSGSVGQGPSASFRMMTACSCAIWPMPATWQALATWHKLA